MAEKKFAKGMFVDTKTTEYGEIIKLSIKEQEFKDFLNENKNEKGYVNIDILTNREGKKYAVLNDFVPQPKAESTAPNESDDLPF